jgi:tRNA(Ile)-lysidine synthase
MGFEKKRYLLAVSGGMDSVCLLDLFLAVLPSDQLAIAHFDHNVRESESAADADFVRALAESAGVEFKFATRPPNGKKDEASLRTDRHGFLEQACFSLKCDFIATGHHLNDQLETLLMRLLRGTGMDGLQGIAPQRGNWIRPLLGTTRSQIEAHVLARSLAYRADSSNQESVYFRNRIRQQLVPVLLELSHSHGGPELFLQKTGALANEIQMAEEALEEKNRALFVHIGTPTAFWFRIDLSLFFRLPLFWRYRFLRSALKRLGVPTLDRLDLQRLNEMMQNKVPSASFTGVHFFQSYGYAYLQTKSQSELARQPRRQIQEGKRVFFPELDMSVQLPEGDWETRFYEPGDELGGGKLKDFFISHRIPQPERRLIPLLVQPGKKSVLWLYPRQFPGLEIEQAGFPFAASLKSLDNLIRP